MSRAVEARVLTRSTVTSATDVRCNHGVWRSMRPGSPTMRASRSTPSTAARTQPGRNERCGGETSANAIKTSTASAIGQRDSPSMTAPSAVVTTSSGRSVMPILPLLARVHDAEPVAFRVSEDDVVGVRRPLVPVHLGGTQARSGVATSAAWSSAYRSRWIRGGIWSVRADAVERDVRTDAVPSGAAAGSRRSPRRAARSRAPPSRTPPDARGRRRAARSSRHEACGRL